MIHRIDHTTITVRDLQRSVDFYTKLLGFVVDHEMWIPESSLGIVFLRLGDTMLELFSVSEIKGEAISDRNNVVGFKHMCLLVDDVDAEYMRLSKAGVLFRSAPATVNRVVRVAFMKDPDNIDIELLSHLDEEKERS
jgi:catechol 2,3-dioxygenase-like lactoylglutathione lyase family enzyme